MRKARKNVLRLCLVAASLAAAPLAAQASAAAPDSAFEAGVTEGRVAARAVGTGMWTVGGFAGGALLGPFGSGLAYAMAGGSSSAFSEAQAVRMKKESRGYQLGYQEAYSRQLTERRKKAALAGGASGTALMLVGAVAWLLH